MWIKPTWWKWLEEIPVCPHEHFTKYLRLFRPILCYKKDWATLLHLLLLLLLVTNYLAIKLPVTDNFSACRDYLAENNLSFPSTPRWVQHFYLSKGLWLIPYTCGSLESHVSRSWGNTGWDRLRVKPSLEFPRGGPAGGSVWTNTQRSTSPGGLKTRWPSGSGNPREKGARWKW